MSGRGGEVIRVAILIKTSRLPNASGRYRAADFPWDYTLPLEQLRILPLSELYIMDYTIDVGSINAH